MECSRWRPVGAARRGRRALPWVRAWRACADVACVGGHGVGRGRGRRPRRPACPWASPMSSPMSFRWRGALGTSRPTMGARMACVCGARCACADMARCVVGADVLGGPRARGRARWRPRGRGEPSSPPDGWPPTPTSRPWSRRSTRKKCWGTTLGCQKRVSPPPSVVLGQVN